MVDQVTDIASKLGKGGRLYQDARERDAGKSTPTPPPKVEHHAPEIPKPWIVQPIEPEPAPKPQRAPHDWQQLAATLLQVLGMAALTGGFGLLYLWLGIVVGGLCLIVLGVAVGLPSVPGRPPRTSARRK